MRGGDATTSFELGTGAFPWDGDRRCEFVVDRAHTSLMDLFTTQVRREYLLSPMRRSSNNLNQLTKRVHETGRVYDADMEDIVQKQNDIWDGLNKVFTRLGSIS